MAQVNANFLYEEDLVKLLPYGVSGADSAKLVRELIRKWVEEQVIYEKAEHNVRDDGRIEQLVADYLARRLEIHSDTIIQQPTHTVRAGNLVHLRSDFTFTLPSTEKLGTLLESLHPTPAVCGLPKEEARNFILENESAPREYYSGFMGPLCMEGETHLYVALRCMRLFPQCHVLYAGGGLLPESTAENEWGETEQKMETMRLCIAASQT